MINAIIVDDERLARKELKRILEEQKKIKIIAECGNADQAIEAIDDKKPDLVFLDIQMPGRNGFELLEDLDYTPEIMFITAYDEYAIKAFEVNALDYILKPIEEERFATSLESVIEKIEARKKNEDQDITNDALSENDQVFLKDGDRCWFVQLKDIRLFESEGNYVRVFFDQEKPLILKSLNNLEKKLSDKIFFRANRKHMINLKWVDKIETWFNGGLLVILKDGKKIEISRRQTSKLKELMSL